MDPLNAPAALRLRNIADVLDPPTKRSEAQTRSPMLGMSRRELREYSLSRALSELSSPPTGPRKGFEFEIDGELRKIHGEFNSNNCLHIPQDVFAHHARRDLTVGTAIAGGFLVETEIGGFIELARPRSVLGLLGATIIEGLVGNVTFPRQATGTTVKMLTSESDTATESQLSVGQLAMTPKTISVFTEVSDKLLKQISPGADRLITNDLLKSVGTHVDFLGIQGTGGEGLPLGIFNTPGIGSVSGTSLGLAGVLEFQTDVGDALSAAGGYLTTAAIAKLLAQREKVANSGEMLWTGNLHTGTLGGFPALSSSNVITAAMVFGSFDQVMIGSWGVLGVEIDPFSKFTSRLVGMRVLHSIDIGVRDPGAFAASTSIT